MEDIKIERSRVGWLLAFWWLIACIIGFGIVGVLLHFPSGFPPSNGARLVIGNAVVGAMFGAVSGVVVGQGVFLRKPLDWSRNRFFIWVVVTTVAFALGHAIGDSAPLPQVLPWSAMGLG